MSGMNTPSQMDFDPTPESVKPLQNILGRSLLGRFMGATSQNTPTAYAGMPTNFGSVMNQLYPTGMSAYNPGGGQAFQLPPFQTGGGGQTGSPYQPGGWGGWNPGGNWNPGQSGGWQGGGY